MTTLCLFPAALISSGFCGEKSVFLTLGTQRFTQGAQGGYGLIVFFMFRNSVSTMPVGSNVGRRCGRGGAVEFLPT